MEFMKTNFLVWNMRGIGTSKRLRKLVNKMHVGLVVILEPFQQEDKILRFVNSLDFNGYYTNVNEGANFGSCGMGFPI